MIERKKIEELIETQLSGTDKFLVELQINGANHIEVFIDSDQLVSISDCVELSQYIESSLDREEQDFDLDVSSAGLDMPLRKTRQYAKYIKQLLNLKVNNEDVFLVRLEAVNEENIEVIPLKKNPNAKKGASKQYLEQEKRMIPFSSITEAKIEIVF